MSASSDHAVVVEEAAVLAADLHARPAGQVTRAATGVDARVVAHRGRPGRGRRAQRAGGDGAGAVTGQTVRVRGEGPQAAEAVAAVAAVLRTAEAAPAERAAVRPVGSQETWPASSAYPTKATTSISVCATTSGITRPHRW